MKTLLASEAVVLATALASSVADHAGIRALIIKGEVSNYYGLRAPRTSADCDVLVDPARFKDYCDLLAGRGWVPRVERETPHFLDVHSVTLVHEGWPCDIDVHSYFPGFFAQTSVIFEHLWNERREFAIAGQPIIAPCPSDALVIIALHAARQPNEVKHKRDLDFALASLEVSGAETERVRVTATVGRAQTVLSEFLGMLGLSAAQDLTEQERELWARHHSMEDLGSLVAWVHSLRQAPLRARPDLLFRALWVSRSEVPRALPSQVPTRAEAWRYRLGRWRRAVATIVVIVRKRVTGR